MELHFFTSYVARERRRSETASTRVLYVNIRLEEKGSGFVLALLDTTCNIVWTVLNFALSNPAAGGRIERWHSPYPDSKISFRISATRKVAPTARPSFVIRILRRTIADYVGSQAKEKPPVAGWLSFYQ